MQSIKNYIDRVDEYLGIKQQQFHHLWRTSLKVERYLCYSRIVIRYSIYPIVALSLSQFVFNKFFDPYSSPDIILEYIHQSNHLDSRMVFAMDSIFERCLQTGETDALSYAAIGKLYASVNQPDFAQTAYYMAHLKNPKQFGANSDMIFETTNKGENRLVD